MNLVKKVSMFFALLFVLMPVMTVGAYASGGIVNAYDITDALYDLERTNIDGAAFDEAKYPLNDSGTPQLLAVNEVGYFKEYKDAENYTLYIYIYNPAVKKDIGNSEQLKRFNLDLDSVVADISVSGNVADYHDFEVNLEFVDASSDGRFLKFKYSCRDSFHSIASQGDTRYYRLSDLTVSAYDGNIVYTCVDGGKEYSFSGEAEYKKVVFTDFEKLELDVQSTVYRTPTGKATNYQNDIFTAYFAVPNSYLETYKDGLTGLKCKYQECLSDYCLFMENQEAYNDAFNFTNSWFPAGEYTDGAPSILWDWNLHHYSSSSEAIFAEHGVNVPEDIVNDFAGIQYYKLHYAVTNVHEEFPRNIYKVSDADNTNYRFSDEEINRIATVWKGNYQVYEYNSKQDILSVKSQYQNNRWKQFFLGGFIFPVDEVDREVEPFYTVDYSMVNSYKGKDDKELKKLSDELLINEVDIEDFISYCDEAKSKNKTVILFRFACRDYYSADAKYYFSEGRSSEDNFVAQFSFFRFFEVIELTFERDGTGYVFPAKSDPGDIVPDITDPETPKDNIQEGVDDIVSGIKDKWNGFKASIGSAIDGYINKIIALVSAIAVLAVVVIVIKLLPSRRSKDGVEIVVKTDSSHSKEEKKKE